MKFLIVICLFAAFETAQASSSFGIDETPLQASRSLNAFVSDGCSLFPEGTKSQPTAWLQCCVEHDVKYWRGGTVDERQAADLNLQQCVSDRGFPKTAALMYLGVRIGGTAFAPTSFRWGYGWYPSKDYQTLTEEELTLVSQKTPRDLSQVKFEKPTVFVGLSPLNGDNCENEAVWHLRRKYGRDVKAEKIEKFYSDESAGATYWIKTDACSDWTLFTFNHATQAACQTLHLQVKPTTYLSRVTPLGTCGKTLQTTSF